MCTLSAKEIGYLKDHFRKCDRKLALLSILTKLNLGPLVSFVKLAD